MGLRPYHYQSFLQQEADATIFGVDLGDKGQKGVLCVCIEISKQTVVVEPSNSVWVPQWHTAMSN